MGPIGVGYGIGYDHQIFSDKHTVGLFAGVVAAAKSSYEETKYHGFLLNYQYFTSGYQNSSWVFGTGIGYGVGDNREYRAREIGAVALIIGYQF